VNARLQAWTERFGLAMGWPVVVRDLRAGQRNPRITWTTIAAVALLSAAVIIGVIGVAGSGTAEPEELGRLMVQIVYWAGVVVVCLVFPGMAAVPLVSEKERKSLDLVLMSQMSPSALALGAVGASTANGFVMLAALAPPLVLALIFGGVPWWVVIAMGTTIAAFGVLTATLGVQASATANTTVRAVLQSYLTAWLVPGVAMCAFGAAFAEILWSVERGYLPDEAWLGAFHVGFITLIVIGLLVLLATLVARNALLPPGGNRATPLRLFYMLFLFVGAGTAIGYAAYVLTAPGLGAGRGVGHEEWRGFGTTVIGIMWTTSLVAVMAMSTEDHGGRRVERRARRWSGPGVLLQSLYPGAARGAAFTILVSGVALCSAGFLLDALERVFCANHTLRWGYRPGGTMAMLALGGWSLLIALGLLGVLARRLLGTAPRARVVTMLATVGVQVVATIGVVWTLARTNELNLGLFNGSLVSIVTLVMGSWMPSGTNRTNLDLSFGGDLIVPFPVLFTLLHLFLAAVVGGILWWVKPPAFPYALEVGPPPEAGASTGDAVSASKPGEVVVDGEGAPPAE